MGHLLFGILSAGNEAKKRSTLVIRRLDMKLHIVGCYSPYPPLNGAGPGYLLEHKGVKVLLDCEIGRAHV